MAGRIAGTGRAGGSGCRFGARRLQRVVDDVDLASISARERVLRHDVKARIEEFNIGRS